MWCELTRVAQTLDPRISNAGLTSTQRNCFRDMPVANHSYKIHQIRKRSRMLPSLTYLHFWTKLTTHEMKNLLNTMSFMKFSISPRLAMRIARTLCACKKSMAGRFPHLATCAKYYLMITCSSVALESAFPDSGNIVNSYRAPLSDANIRELKKTRPWIKLLR